MSWRLSFHSTKVLFSYLFPYKVKTFRDAIFDGKIDVIRQLAAERPRLLQQAIDADGNTAIGLAVLLGEIEIVKTLLELGSNPNIANGFDGNHPLVFLARLRPEENSKTATLTEILLQGGSNPLHEVRYQADSATRLDVTQTPSFHETPLLCCIRYQNEAVLNKMIEHGVDINALNPETGTTPLMLAATLGFLNICNILLDSGADISAADHSGNTALHLAVQGFGDQLPIVQKLLEQGADANAANEDGFTPVMIAKQLDNEAIIKALNTPVDEKMEPPTYHEVAGVKEEHREEHIEEHIEEHREEHKEEPMFSFT